MQAKERFLKTFSKYTPTPSMELLLDKIVALQVRVNKQAKAIECRADFAEKISPFSLSELENQIKTAYAINSVVILPTFRTMDWERFTMAELIELVLKYHGSIVNGFFEGASKVFQKNTATLEITLSQGHCAQLLYNAKLDKAFESTINKVFGADINVSFFGLDVEFMPDNDTEEELKRDALLAYERHAAASAVEETVIEDKSASFFGDDAISEVLHSEDSVISGGMKFDISSADLVYGKPTKKTLSCIRDALNVQSGTAAFCGLIVSVDSKDTRELTKVRYNFCVTDNDSSVTVKFLVKKEDEGNIKKLKTGTAIMVAGKPKFDKYDNEIVIDPASISIIDRIGRKDNAKLTRVELHLHTNMSTMDGFCKPDEVIKLAKDWNMPAIAVTDHGNVQSFPEMMIAAEKAGVKALYGMEGYLVDDTARILYNGSEKDSEKKFSVADFVIFDIETTGLSPQNCGITEIGAVRYRNGEIVDEFETYVNPKMPIPANIVELTGITDEMVKDAPSPVDAIKRFIEFAGDDILVAHNANFDIGFIKKVAEDNIIAFTNPYLDTVTLSRFVNPELSRHRLDSLRDYFKLGDFKHHRALDDTKMLAAIFCKMVDKLQDDGITTIAQMEHATENSANPKKLRPHHITILVKSGVGLQNLYKLISMSYLEYFHRSPRIPKTILGAHREGLLIGSACQAGELYSAVLEGKSDSDLKKIASFYDYFEIMPIDNNIFLVDDNRVGTDRESGIAELRRMNKKIYDLGKSLKKLVVATGDVHYLEPEDSIYRTILQFGMQFSDADKESKFHLRTTEEMLAEFQYLGEKAAFEVVVENTRKVADLIDNKVRPIPKGTFNPSIPDSDNTLRRVCYENAMELYGHKGVIPQIVIDRLEKELGSVIANGFSSLYIAARELVAFSERSGYLVGSRGSVGSSVIAALAGISEVNPLQPHRRCPNCRYTDFITDQSVGSGFDLESDSCPKCDAIRICDGHDIPFETFLGFKGEKAPDIDLNFSGEIQAGAHKYTEELFGENNVFRAGTIGTLASKTAYGFVKKYLEDKGKTLTKAEDNRLVAGCLGVKRTTGQHPGGIVVVPEPYTIFDFTPIQHPADKSESEVITTHFAFDYLHDTLQKLDILGHDVPTKYRVIEDMTGIDVKTITLNDPKVMSLFTSTEALGISPAEAGVETGTLGIPECGTKYVRQMMIDAQPKKFSDLLQISGLSHGEGIWIGNGKDLIDKKICTISEIIGTRDSIMLFLIKHDMEPSLAFKITEDVRKGRGLLPEFVEAMKEKNVPDWYIESCKKIKYMFPKAHAAAYMIAALRLAWYKVYEPLAFYACYFSVQSEGIDAETVMQGKRHVVKLIAELATKGINATQKEADTQTALEIVNEMFARKIKFLPIDLYKSHKNMFTIEDGEIRLPLNTISGLGNNAAEKIYSCLHEQDVRSLEELKIKASLSQTVVDTLIKNKCLGDLPESEQLTLW